MERVKLPCTPRCKLCGPELNLSIWRVTSEGKDLNIVKFLLWRYHRLSQESRDRMKIEKGKEGYEVQRSSCERKSAGKVRKSIEQLTYFFNTNFHLESEWWGCHYRDAQLSTLVVAKKKLWRRFGHTVYPTSLRMAGESDILLCRMACDTPFQE